LTIPPGGDRGEGKNRNAEFRPRTALFAAEQKKRSGPFPCLGEREEGGLGGGKGISFFSSFFNDGGKGEKKGEGAIGLSP